MERLKFVEAQKVQPKGKTGRADVAPTMINELYRIERELKDASDEQRCVAPASPDPVEKLVGQGPIPSDAAKRVGQGRDLSSE